MSQSHRPSLTYSDPAHSGPATVVVKLAAETHQPRDGRRHGRLLARGRASTTSSRHASAGRWRSAGSPTTTRPRAGSRCCCEDVAPATVGDQIAGCSRRRRVLRWRSSHECTRRCSTTWQPAASAWLNRPTRSARRCCVSTAARLPGALRQAHRRRTRRGLCERFVAVADDWLAERTAAARARCTATTGWTTCCSARPVRRAARSSTGRRSRWGTAMTDVVLLPRRRAAASRTTRARARAASAYTATTRRERRRGPRAGSSAGSEYRRPHSSAS